MDNEEMGKFIQQKRKEHNLTQKQLAEKLNVTDKAISKWERGLSCPDISLLSKISEILQVSVSELLNGENNGKKTAEIETNVDTALKYAEKNQESKNKTFHNVLTLALSVCSFIAVFVCFLVDFAVNGRFSWSLIVFACVLLSYLVSFPIIKFGKRGIAVTLLASTALAVPFILVLKTLLMFDTAATKISISICAAAFLYLWALCFIFKILKSRKLLAYSIALILLIPLNIAINLILAKILLIPIIDLWDIMSFAIVFVISAVLLFFDYKKKRINDN